MNKTYQAVYIPSGTRFYNATIFLSSITLSIRFVNENNQSTDVYWLAENILSLEEVTEGAVLTYKNREGQLEKLKIRDQELLIAIKKNFSHHRFIGGWKHHVVGNVRNKLLLVAGILLLLIVSGYFWFVPWLGERIAGNISKEWEISLGQKMHRSMMGRYKVDSSKTRLINRYFKKLNYPLNYPVSITVVESKETNAFAIPGGHIVVYTSILDKMTRHEELAALLSHEISHIELRHSLRNMFRSMARKMFILLIVGNESGLAGFLVDNADNLKGLEYSRSLETEADDHGIHLMKSGQIDLNGMLGLMEMLRKETENKESVGFLSTHPLFASRIENITRKMGDKQPNAPANEELVSLFKMLRSESSARW